MSKIKELESDIRELYLVRDMTKKEVAEKLGLRYNTLSSFLYKNNIVKDLKISKSMRLKRKERKMENQEIEKKEEAKVTKKRIVRKKAGRKTTVKKAVIKKAVKKVAPKKFNPEKVDKEVIKFVKLALSKISAKNKKEFVESIAKLANDK